jgi:cation transport ATPase
MPSTSKTLTHNIGVERKTTHEADAHSTVDQSLVTGESTPVEKTVNEVIDGSASLIGTRKVDGSRVGEKSCLQQVARYVEE